MATPLWQTGELRRGPAACCVCPDRPGAADARCGGALRRAHCAARPPAPWPPWLPPRREAIRSRAQLLITNPDMLHMSLLPVHQHFR